MVSLGPLFKTHQESKAFSSLINISFFVNSWAFLLKSGEVGAAIRLEPRDSEGLDESALCSVAQTIKSAIGALNDAAVVTTYVIKRSNPSVPKNTITNPVAAEAANCRREFLDAKGAALYETEAYLTVILKPEWATEDLFSRLRSIARSPLKAIRQSFSARQQVTLLDSTLSSAVNALHHAVLNIVERTGEHLKGRLLQRDEAVAFFRRAINPDSQKAEVFTPADDENLDFALGDSVLECNRSYLRVDDRYVKTLTLKQFPVRTYANMLGQLTGIKASLRLVTEWQPLDQSKAAAHIRNSRRHFNATKTNLLSHAFTSDQSHDDPPLKDPAKEALVEELADCLAAIEVRGARLGYFTMTLVIIGNSLDEVDRASAEAMRIVGTQDASLNEERYNGLNAYRATLPAGHPFNLRRSLVTDENYSDLACWFLPSSGEKRNTFLGSGYLAALETEDHSLFYYNLHVGDVGHTAVFGPTGTGKSFWLNFIIAHAQQYDPYTFIFDVGGSYRWLTELCGGAYISFTADGPPFDIGPCCLEPTKENLEFLFAFFKLLIESGEFRMTDGDDRELFEAIRSLYVLDPDQRRLSTLAGLLPRHISVHLRRWTEGEQYGHWFDKSRDTFTHARFQTINFEGMSNLGVVRDPALFYLLHRANDIVLDPSLSTVLKTMWVDEAWFLLKHKVIRDYIVSALRTWRKKNAVMVLSTQSLDDLADAEAIRPVVENCPTKILFPTEKPEFYSEVLGLNGAEQSLIRGLTKKRQFLLKREVLSKVLNLNVDPKSYWLFTTNPFEAKRRDELVNRVGLTAALEILKGESR